MGDFKLPSNVMNKIQKESSHPVKKLKDKKKTKENNTIEDIVKDPSDDNISGFVELYKAKVLKEYEHPAKILADQTDMLISVQKMIFSQLLQSVKEGYLDIQMAEGLRRFAKEIKDITVELRPDWEVVIDDSIDESVIDSIMDLETFFEFLGTVDSELVEQFIEFRLQKMNDLGSGIDIEIE